MPRINKTKCFVYVDDVQKILGISQTEAYKIIRQLNKELNKKGYLTFQGRVAKKYFNERFDIYVEEAV